MNRNYATASDLINQDRIESAEQLNIWADSRETSLPIAVGILAIASGQREAQDIWADPTDAEMDQVTMAAEEYMDHGDYPFDPEMQWGEETIRLFKDVDDERLKAAIVGIEENNRFNDGRWDDWSNAQHVCDEYETDCCNAGRKILDRAIESNGATLATDLPAVERAVWGKNFAGSFWDRV